MRTKSLSIEPATCGISSSSDTNVDVKRSCARAITDPPECNDLTIVGAETRGNRPFEVKLRNQENFAAAGDAIMNVANGTRWVKGGVDRCETIFATGTCSELSSVSQVGPGNRV